MEKIKLTKFDQKIFSELSNDYNPIHLDEKYSYKTLFNKPIIYGILLTIKSLDNLKIKKRQKINYIKAEFINFVNINDLITIDYDTNIIKIYKENNILCTKIKYLLSDDNDNELIFKNNNNNLINPLSDQNPKESYLYNLNINLEILEKYYNNVFHNFNLLQIFQIINLSTFVGMITPGLNSIFNSFELSYIDNNYNDLYTLFFNIDNFDKTHKICLYNFEGKNINGNITCLYRPESIRQIKIKDLKIDNEQFKNEKVLVIGGSRGLGEVISKIFFAGGADVTLTYFNCHEEALNIQRESENKIKILKYDVLNDYYNINNITNNVEFTKIFYMATPKLNKYNTFNNDMFENYYNYYCKGFILLFNTINKNNLKYIFYPSTMYLDITNDYLEYTLSKNIAENIVNNLKNNNNNICFDCIRLPRLLTDLTNNIINIAKDPVDYFLEYYKIKTIKKNITVLSNLNIDFISMYLNNNNNKYLNNLYDIKTLPFGQLYQSLIFPTNDIIDSEYLFFLLSLEDILNDDIILYYKNEYVEIINNFYKTLVDFCNKYFNYKIYFFKLKQKFISPFDDSNYSVQKLLEYFNNKISEISNIKIIDNYYNENIFDINFYLESRSSFSLNFYEHISNKITGIILNNLGKTIKCIVVDLDNTLWEGVLVDDGVDNIIISNDYPGNKWRLFQKILKNYQEKGIVLAICSKNNEELVYKALEKKENLLKKEDFVAIKSNWNPKSQNIYEIAKNINISEEHILFIDDNIIEREEVKQNLPKCNILEINNIEPIDYIKALLEYPLLYNNNILESDLNKHKQYITKSVVENNKSEFKNLEDFYYSLQTNITFKYVDDSNFKRVHQLILKTNQFNLNKYLFNEKELEDYLNNNKGIILEYNDKFTNFDQVGIILLKYTENEIIIDNIILSCRVFNRDFEKCIFNLLKKIAYTSNKNLIGILKKTDKNTIFHDIYTKFGFSYENNKDIFINNNISSEKYPLWINCDDTIILSNKFENKIITEISPNISNNLQQISLEKFSKNKIENLDININIEKEINDIKIFICESLFMNNYNINNFTDVDNFSSITMVFLMNKLSKKYNYNFKINIFFNNNHEIININDFCDKIYNLINKNNLLDNNLENNINSKNVNLSDYKLFVINNNDELNKFNNFLVENYKNKFAYLDIDILKWNLKGYRDIDNSFINILHSRKYIDEINYIIEGILLNINIYTQYILDNKLLYEKSNEIIIWKYINNSLESLNPINYLKNTTNAIIASTLIEDTSLFVLRNSNFFVIDFIPSYVLALKTSYKNLILDDSIEQNEIDEWIMKTINNNKLSNDILEIQEWENIDCIFLEKIWINFSLKYNLFSYYKNSDYFKWRFIDSLYYKYLINGNNEEGYIIWREEETFTNNIGVRIIDILPGFNSLSNDEIFNNFIRKFINFCIKKNYELVDFLCTSKILNNYFFENNFKLKNIENNGITSCPIYFKIKKHFFNRNMVIYIKNNDILNNNNIYFTKSMTELDKPNCRFCKRSFCEKLYSDDNCI
jgi:FkbH-like protein